MYFPRKTKPGDSNVLGRWGGEAIVWRVLDVKDGRALLITEKSIDCRQYHHEVKDITWEGCSLRSWLNGEFFQGAFSASEQTMIAKTRLRNEDNPRFGTPGGADTNDHVFLLSTDEATRYFRDNDDRTCCPTAFVKAKGEQISSVGTCWPNFPAKVEGACCWWLRSVGFGNRNAARVIDCGMVDSTGYGVQRGVFAIRPAMWVNL